MPLFGRRRQPNRTLVAAGRQITQDAVEGVRRVGMPWQDRAFEYYNAGGPAWYAAQFYSRMLAPLQLIAVEKNEDGDLAPTENEIAIAQLERIQDPGGGRSSLLGTYGRLMFLVGEVFLFVTLDDDGNEQWEMLSPQELSIEDTQYVRRPQPGVAGTAYRRADGESLSKGDAVAFRLWRRHPQWSDLADSPMRSALDDLEELIMLTRTVRARARSRMAGPGVLFIDDRISPAPPEPVGDEDPEEDQYLAALTLAMTTPIANEGVASEVVPIVTRVPVPEGSSVRDMVHLLQITDPNELYQEIGLRMECIRRISIELDMPPEVLTGTADLNHWSAWLVDENTWKGHGEPVAKQLVDDLTASFYRPMLRELGVENWPDHAIGYDPSGVVNHPDRSKDAKDLHSAGAIGDAALRDANNFDEADAQSEEERRVWLSIYSRDPTFATTGISGRLTPAGGAAEGLTEGAVTPIGDTVDGGQSAAEAPKRPPTTTPGGQQAAANGNGLVPQLIIGAAQVALLRAREAAGNRIRSLAKRDSVMLDMIEGVKAGEVAFALGRDRVKALGAPSERDLVRSAHGLITEALRAWGIMDVDLINMIAESIEQYAARTLYEPRAAQLPPPLANYISGLATGMLVPH